MATVTVITGLAGSGKTRYLNNIVGVERFNEGVRPDKPENFQKFLDVLATGKDCAIVEIAYIAEFWRNQLVNLVHAQCPETIFDWVYFENDIEAANANCLNDPDRSDDDKRGNVANNKRWTYEYEIPVEAVTLKIYRIPSLPKSS